MIVICPECGADMEEIGSVHRCPRCGVEAEQIQFDTAIEPMEGNT